MKLWEAEHPYHCEPGENRNSHYASWSDFLRSSWATHDPDIVLLFRWVWYQREEKGDDDLESVLFHFMLQHKGYQHTCHIMVRRTSDEPLVREYLARHWELMKKFWAPLSEST